MIAKVAIATVSGKAYFMIVEELKRRNVPFFSLIPGQLIPAEVKVVITTENEKHLMYHERILVYENEKGVSTLVGKAIRILKGKETYEKIIIGIDPGEVIGLVVVADGNVIETENCFGTQGTLKRVESVMSDINLFSTRFTVKIGNGFPACRDTLLKALDQTLPIEAVLEVVSEAGTNRPTKNHRRGLRDIVSALRIAGRTGHVQPRGKTDESNG